ncbi:hypothetical protein ABEG18_23700 [Alsobacter sp. KACC 23698]|uniref:Uncharacterized protein n=1 Tax=Alsobacter sp. KACC 23698 TaxID=3149229 RepID=A0AAU7JED0_9HYPH
MLDQLISASEALRGHDLLALMPAGCRCPECGETRMVASPAPLRCASCSAEMTVMDGPEPAPSQA